MKALINVGSFGVNTLLNHILGHAVFEMKQNF